jgi:hypothetical protein
MLSLYWKKRLSHEVGWGYKDVIDRLEEKRKIKAQAFHERKVCGTICYIPDVLFKFHRLLQSNCVKRPSQTSHRRSHSSLSLDTKSRYTDYVLNCLVCNYNMHFRCLG